jgi:hypothetical protein
MTAMKGYKAIRGVRPATERPVTLTIDWDGGTTAVVALGDIARTTPVLRPLLDPAFFGRARVSPEGYAVEWDGDVELSAAQLWRWAGEQSGAFMPAETFRAWRQENHFSLSAAAEALGLSRRQIAYYNSGEQPIPKVVALACRAIATDRRNAA